MRVLIVTQYFWPEDFRINELAARLTALGHSVTVLTGLPNYPAGSFYEGYSLFGPFREAMADVRIVRVPIIPRGARKIRLSLNYLSFAVSASFLGPLMHREKPDVIFVYEPSPVTVGIPAVVMRAITGAPVVFWIQDLWPETPVALGVVRSQWLLRRITRLVEWIYEHCDQLLVTSLGFVEAVQARNKTGTPVSYFPQWAQDNGANIQESSFIRKLEASLPKGFLVMFAGNIGAAQSFETILDAADILRDHRDIHWVILGDGRMAEWVNTEARRRNLVSVRLLGRRPSTEMASFFYFADALLVTLKKDPVFSLTVPQKIQAYLASGKPIVAALDGEGAEVIRRAGAGIACGAEDPQGLADAVLRLSQMSADERHTIGLKARSYFEAHYEFEHLMTRLDQLLRDIACKGRRTHGTA